MTFNPFLAIFRPNYYHDTQLRPQRRLDQGAHAQTDKIAIFLIFPKFGVLESHLHALRYLIDNGYSPLVVSNLPLSEGDLVRLKPCAWRIMQRQNFGYDFGGYRDAVLDLADRLPQLQRLVFLNDSCWFPLAGKANWLHIAEASGKDVFCADQHRSAVSDDDPPQDVTRRAYFTSYAMSLSPRVLSDPNYLRFWRNLRLSNGKGRTVRRGEHGHSHWLQSRGYTCDALSKNKGIVTALAALPDDQFAAVWRAAIVAWDAESLAIYRDLDAPNPDRDLRDKQLALLAGHIAYTGVAMTLPQFAITQRNHPFLKKAVSGQNIATLRRIIADLDDPMSPHMLQEMDLRYGS